MNEEIRDSDLKKKIKKDFKLAGFDSNKPTRNKRRWSFAVVEWPLITGVTPALLTSRLLVAISKLEMSRPPSFTTVFNIQIFSSLRGK
jgi:hypothetical protein